LRFGGGVGVSRAVHGVLLAVCRCTAVRVVIRVR
jgi:hypothetical protein